MKLRSILSLLLVLCLLTGLSPALAASALEPDEHKHNWVTDFYDAPTCTEGGWRSSHCSICGEARREELKPLGHDYGPRQPDIPATCTGKGRDVRVCSRDSRHIWYFDVDPLGHDWGEWEVVTPAGVGVPGLEQRVCRRDASHVETREIPPLEGDETPDPGDRRDDPPVPGEKKAGITLSVTCLTPDPFFFDGSGQTGPVLYSAMVVNTGDLPVHSGHIAYDTGIGEESAFPEVPITLYPGEGAHIPVTTAFRDDLLETDGCLHITFRAVFYENATSEAVHSNPVELRHGVEEIPPWNVSSISLFKTIVGDPELPYGYQAGETVNFVVFVTNDSDVELDGVLLHDVLFPEEDEGLHQLQPHETRALSYPYVVKESDLGGPVVNYAIASWTDPASGAMMQAVSNPAIADTWKPSEKTGGLRLLKYHDNDPDNGKWFVPEEIVQFRVLVENTSDSELYNVEVKDYLMPAPYIIAYFPVLMPHESHTIPVAYVVQEYPDAFAGMVHNTAHAEGVDGTGVTRYADDEDDVRAGYPDKTASLFVLKEELDPPACGYYHPGETIHYKVTILNDGMIDLTDVEVYDCLSASWSPIGSITTLHVGQSQSFFFDYPTSEWDIPFVVNSAIGFYTTPEAIGVPVGSNDVISWVAGEPPETPETGEGGSCVTVLDGANGNGQTLTLTPCADHLDVLNMTLAMTCGPADTAVGWQQAAGLWKEAVRAEYEEMIGEAGGPLKAALVDDQIFFTAWADAFEQLMTALHPDDPRAAHRAVTVLWMRQCAELCYLRANAPAPRPDSLVTGTYGVINLAPAEHGTLAFELNPEGHADIRLQLDRDLAGQESALQAALAKAETREDVDRAFQRIQRVWVAGLNGVLSARYTAGNSEVRAALGRARQALDAFSKQHQGLLAVFYPDAPETVSEQIANLWRDVLLTLSEE